MSANEEQDWSDSLDFESLAEEHTGPEPKKAPEATEEDFGDTFDDAFADETGDDVPAEASDEYADEGAEEALDVEAVDRPPRAAKKQRSKGVSGTGLGILFAFSIMVAAVGSGGALLVALGIDPASLWRPEGLSQLDQLLNLDRNPLNLVYIVVLATVLLTLLGAWAVARSVRRVGERAALNATLLEKIATLRIDEDHGWQDPLLKKHPTLSAFVDENIGAWRLNGTRQKRSAGLEGEVQRLTRALTTDNREDLSGRYDHPCVGSLSDEIVRVLDERGSARREVESVRAKDREEAEALVRAAVDAASWNTSFTDQVGVQNAAATGLESRLQEMAKGLGGEHTDSALEEARVVVTQMRKELREGDGENQTDEAVSYLHDLVERGTKLAFQIAMEVARLGPRGERLLPMTTTLEELTTNFRKVADRLDGSSGNGDDAAQLRWDRHLATLQERLAGVGDARLDTVKRSLEDLVPVVSQLTGRLGSLASGFDKQTERLRELGQACAALTGVDYDTHATPSEGVGQDDDGDLGLTRFDPFSNDPEEVPEVEEVAEVEDHDDTLAVDPFASGDPVLEVAPEEEPLVEPLTDPMATDETVAEVKPAPVVESVVPTPAPTPAPAPVPEPEPQASAPAPAAATETVYELQELGATPAGPPPAPDKEAPQEPQEPEEAIYDLADFDAVRVG